MFSLSLFADNYTYLVNEYTKETQLEAKIVIKIAKDIFKNKPIKLFIPDIKDLDKTVYSKEAILVQSCQEADFVFKKYAKEYTCESTKNKPYLLTNNYKQLLVDKSYFGAFFWSKSRPNIVFIKDRLVQWNIDLPNEYRQFIEDF